MIKDRNIQSFIKKAVHRLLKELKPQKIILFGSYAYGRPTSDSDLDLLIIKKTDLSFFDRTRQASRIIGNHLFPLDLIVLTPAEIKNRLKAFDPFLEEILSDGKVLYAKNR